MGKNYFRAFCAFVLMAMIFVVSCSEKPETTGSGEEMVINVALPLEIKGFDPSQANDLYSHRALVQIYEPLYQYSYLERPYKVEPLLAASTPEVSEDKLTFTIPVRKDVKFQDDPCFEENNGKGRPVTAQDFIYSFKRIADKKVNSNGWWIFRDRIVGLDEFRQKSLNLESGDYYNLAVEGLSAPDDHTLVIRLKKPYPQLIYVLTMAYTCVVPREAVEYYGEEFMNHPVGTGPFQLEEWIRKSRIVYTQSPSFRGEKYPSRGTEEAEEMGLLEDAGESIPFADKIVFNIIKEDSALWLEFQSGNLDRSSLPKDNFKSAINADGELRENLSRKGVRLWKEPRLDLTYIAFNMEDPAFGKSRALRRALSLSLNRRRIIRHMYNGRAIAAEGPIPPGLVGYRPGFDNPWLGYDPERAKEQMKIARKELGLEPGEKITLTYESQSNDITARQMDELVISSLEEAGVEFEYNVNTWTQFLDKIKNKKAQIWGAAWGADYPDAENFLQLLYGPNSSPGDNSANYDNPEFNRLYEQISTMMDSPERTEIYHRMVDIVTRDCPWIFGTHRISFSLYHNWLKNYLPHDLAQNTLKYYKIDKKLREETMPKLR